MAVLTVSGRAAQAISVASRPLHLAWGRGDPAWDAVPAPESTLATALVDEVGRRGSPQLSFVARDDASNDVVLPSGRWRIVGAPGPDGRPATGVASNTLHARWQFEHADGALPEPETLRELAVFLDTRIAPAVLAATPGLSYFQPPQVADPGTMLALQRVPKFLRSPQTRQAFAFVLVF